MNSTSVYSVLSRQVSRQGLAVLRFSQETPAVPKGTDRIFRSALILSCLGIGLSTFCLRQLQDKGYQSSIPCIRPLQDKGSQSSIGHIQPK